MSDAKSFQVAEIFAISKVGEGDYIFEDVPQARADAPAFLGKENIDYDNDVIKVKGWIDTETFDYYFTVWVVGKNAGTWQGKLDIALKFGFSAGQLKGSVTFYVKDGHQLRVAVDLKIKFDGSIKNDWLIIKW
ncbi:uncharacterized protein N7473_001702 [Penicillium subrubescens]|uniref:uncharacterized protein n=1 Tax=Penicillium subrubescens TaxID=1316194 RepID=UPI0025459F62|nr:uncharacterized protein N7473_001702 [Penicillium subrubescens]KAJ5904786.1 hypothetical protein N7473_001702 [Penicillium subrubescens]